MTKTLLVLLMVLGMSTAAIAKDAAAPPGMGKGARSPFMAALADLKWVALPERPGMEYALITGDPATRAYTQMRKVPAGTANPLHRHSSELTNVIISGVWYTGPDSASARDFGPGSIVMMPADWPHVSGCRPGADCVFYQDGKGRFDFKPVPPGAVK